MVRRSDLSPAQFVQSIGAWLLWLVCLSVVAGALFAALYLTLGYSLFATRLALCMLISACLALVLFGIHKQAAGNRRKIFLMKIVLGLFCFSILVVIWCVSATGSISRKMVYVTNDTKKTIHVKISRIGQIGVLGDEARGVDCPAGQSRSLSLAGSGSGFTYVVVACEYYLDDSAVDLPAVLQGIDKFLPKSLRDLKCRAIFPSDSMPNELEFVTRDGKTVLLQGTPKEAPAVEQEEEEDDPFRIPLPPSE